MKAKLILIAVVATVSLHAAADRAAAGDLFMVLPDLNMSANAQVDYTVGGTGNLTVKGYLMQFTEADGSSHLARNPLSGSFPSPPISQQILIEATVDTAGNVIDGSMSVFGTVFNPDFSVFDADGTPADGLLLEGSVTDLVVTDGGSGGTVFQFFGDVTGGILGAMFGSTWAAVVSPTLLTTPSGPSSMDSLSFTVPFSGTGGTIDVASAVPTPATAAAGLALFGLAFLARRRHQRRDEANAA